MQPEKFNYEIENKKNEYIPVDDNIKVGCRLHLHDSNYDNLIYFHGNAELVSEYDEFSEI